MKWNFVSKRIKIGGFNDFWTWKNSRLFVIFSGKFTFFSHSFLLHEARNDENL
jgi:hypothetical protein